MDFDFLGTSPAMQQIRAVITRVAQFDAAVYLEGEEGTPKKEVASLIHKLGKRRGEFVAANMGAIDQGIHASELFGQVEGSFGSAEIFRKGLVDRADGGTLFLDEIETLSPELQASLLRLLQEREYSPIGGEPRHVDLRVIASLKSPAHFNKLRRDLYFRLNIINIKLPPLRDRKDEIADLSQRYLASKSAPPLSNEAIAVLKRHNFQGNDRELYSILERAAVFADGEQIREKDLALVELKWEFASEDIDTVRRELATVRAELTALQRTAIVAAPIWEGRRFNVKPDSCFVLMPFAEVLDTQNVYKNHVKNVVENRCNLRCERADDIADISGVMQSVWESVNQARIIIAEMTDRNPNVFYELGVAHTLGKPVIMIMQSMDYVPSDLKHLRCIVYEYKPSSISRFEDKLEKTIRTALETTPSATSRRSHLV